MKSKKEKEPIKETKISSASSAPTVQKTPDDGWVCNKCGTKNNINAQFCKNCGQFKWFKSNFIFEVAFYYRIKWTSLVAPI